MSEMATPTTPRSHAGLDDVLAWMDHEASLLEILAYRLDGLSNVLRSKRHGMVCTAASDVDTVHDQLMRAAVHRDLALLPFANGGADLPSIEQLSGIAADHDRTRLTAVRERIDQAIVDVERAREECAAAASNYRPGQSF